jgi:hypothetical protein
MTPDMPMPNDRAAFNSALADIHHDHAAMRDLAEMAIRSGFPTDETLSLAEMVMAHERAEARLFALPFVTRPPESVTARAARAHRHSLEYTTGTYHLPDRGAAAALFVDNLLAHIAVEDAWLAREDEHQKERLKTHD